MTERKRKSAGFMIRQRAFLKLYLITKVEEGRSYGWQLNELLQKEFDDFGYQPDLSEIYRSLHELTDEGILRKREEIAEGAKRKKLELYTILDKEAAKAYKNLVKHDLDRCEGLLKKAIRDNFA